MKEFVYYIGVDCGKTGGIAVLGPDGPAYDVMPVIGEGKQGEINVFAISDWLDFHVPAFSKSYVAIEKQQAFPNQGGASNVTTGYGEGLLVATFRMKGISMCRPRPAAWKKKVLVGYSTKDKKGAIKYCLNEWPGMSFKRTDRCKKDHDGICDALCLARFAQMTHV